MKKLLAILSVTIMSISGFAQINAYYVLGSTGGFSSVAAGSIDYTVGEMAAVKMYSAGGHIITQGFQQGYLSISGSTSTTSNISLPVTLIDFSGYHINGTNHLIWQTASEIDNDGFEVERLSSKGDYESLGFIKGAGNSSSRHDYSLDDHYPLTGDNYYRLKQKDKDSKTTYSKTISISAGESAAMSMSIYPNPSTDHFNIVVYYGQSTSGTITISDILGTLIYEGPIDIEAGVTYARMDLGGYAKGQYFVRLTTGTSTSTMRISKQ